MTYQRADGRRLEGDLVTHGCERTVGQVEPGEEVTRLGHGRATAHCLQGQSHLVRYRHEPSSHHLGQNRIQVSSSDRRGHHCPIFTWMAPTPSVAALPPGGTTTTHPGSWSKHGPLTS